MIELNYHHLYCFWAVARSGSIAAAKGRLGLTQPTLSSHLKELERSCDAALLNRGKKGVSLTPEGRAVFDYCERIFSPAEELAAMLRNGFAAPAIFRIGIQARVSKEVIVHLLQAMRAIDRKARVVTVNADLNDLGAKLDRRALDMAVTSEEVPSQAPGAIQKRLVAKLPVAFVASPAVAKSVRSFPADLAKVPVLLRTRDHPIRRQVDRFFNSRGIIPSIEAELEDTDVIRQLASMGRGAAALNLLAVQPDVRSGKLVRLHRQATGIEEQVWLSCATHPSQNDSVRRIVGALMNRFELPAGDGERAASLKP